MYQRVGLAPSVWFGRHFRGGNALCRAPRRISLVLMAWWPAGDRGLSLSQPIRVRQPTQNTVAKKRHSTLVLLWPRHPSLF